MKLCYPCPQRQPDVEEWAQDLVGRCPRYRTQADEDARFLREPLVSAQTAHCFNWLLPTQTGEHVPLS